MPLLHGEQEKAAKENAWPAAHDWLPLKKASTRCTSLSESFTLYTRTDWIAKSEVSPGALPALIASLSYVEHPL
jgi:hypothetical protein